MWKDNCFINNFSRWNWCSNPALLCLLCWWTMKNQSEFPFCSWLQNSWNKKGLSLKPQCFQSTHCWLTWNYSNNAAQNPFQCLLCNSSLKDRKFSLGLEFGANTAGSAWSGQCCTCWDQWKLATSCSHFSKGILQKTVLMNEEMIPFFPSKGTQSARMPNPFFMKALRGFFCWLWWWQNSFNKFWKHHLLLLKLQEHFESSSLE